MGFIFRKSINLGPLRINIGKNGISLSTGVPGLRIGRNSKGKTYTSAGIPGIGMPMRLTHGKKKQAKLREPRAACSSSLASLPLSRC